jgi:hypothetical protein
MVLPGLRPELAWLKPFQAQEGLPRAPIVVGTHHRPGLGLVKPFPAIQGTIAAQAPTPGSREIDATTDVDVGQGMRGFGPCPPLWESQGCCISQLSAPLRPKKGLSAPPLNLGQPKAFVSV